MTEPGDNCKKVSFAGGAVRGTVEVVRRPADPGCRDARPCTGCCRPTINGTPQTGEIYSYRANFGNYQVIVTANPLVVPGSAGGTGGHQARGEPAGRGRRRHQELTDVARAELDADPRSGGPGRLRDRMLPGALT